MRPTFCPECKEPLGRPRGGGAAPLVCPICSTAVAPEPTAVTDGRPSPRAQERGGGPKRQRVEPWSLVTQPLGPAWRRVHFGLGLIKWGTVAALAALAFTVLAVLAVPGHAALPTEDHLGLLAVAVLSALSVVLGLLGRLCCCSVPPETGARLPAVLAVFGTLLAQVLAGFVVFNVVLLALRDASPLLLIPALAAWGGAALLAEVVFLVFLYRVGRCLQEPAVRRRVVGLVIGAAVIVVGVAFAAFFLVLSAAAVPPAPAGRPPAGAVPVGAALVQMLYLDLINATRRALARRLAREVAGRGVGA